MGERTSYPPGTFSWVDLATNDTEGAKTFYGALLGWEYEDTPIGEGQFYSMARIDGHDVAAIGPLQGPEGVPPHWNCYVTVADADAAAARARDLGASVVAEPFDVFDAGRMAVIQDPQGAMLSVWQPNTSIGATLVNVEGALTWNDLISPDIEASARFYGDLFGWEIAEVEGSDGQYWSIANDGSRNGGIMPLPPGGHPAWNLYFAVGDTNAAVARAGELGGQTVMGPMDIPNGSRLAVLADPQGAVFSVATGEMDD
jgi:predicted enzyme related to lactoylglutathione lyase